jgi:hypothetical protein
MRTYDAYWQDNPFSFPKDDLIDEKFRSSIIELDGNSDQVGFFFDELEAMLRESISGSNFQQFWANANVLFDRIRLTYPGWQWISILKNCRDEFRSVFEYLRIKSHSQSFLLSRDDSILKLNVPDAVLSKALLAATKLNKKQNFTENYPVYSDRQLITWIYKEIKPLYDYVMKGAYIPFVRAHLRNANHSYTLGRAESRFRRHPLGNYHYDITPFSVNVMIYLSDVTENDGPFQYLKNSDKLPEYYSIRAVRKKLFTHYGVDSIQSDPDRSSLISLPRCLRMAENYGNHFSEKFFIKQGHQSVCEPSGTAVIFDGHETLHQGGFPLHESGARQSLFINMTFLPDCLKRFI